METHFLSLFAQVWKGTSSQRTPARRVKEISRSHPLRFADRGSLDARAQCALPSRSLGWLHRGDLFGAARHQHRHTNDISFAAYEPAHNATSYHISPHHYMTILTSGFALDVLKRLNFRAFW
jgi:hypothetical protein